MISVVPEKGKTMAEHKAWVMIPKSKNKGTEVVIDMRPLVLCKDCKHYNREGWASQLCVLNEITTTDNWFCADGEQAVNTVDDQ